jgi:hypothetical protein
MQPINPDHFTQAVRFLLDEVFDNVHGAFLDPGTSLFETLATISAAEASVPVGGRCATLAAQVKHVAFYLQVMDRSVREGQFARVDWGEIWRTVNSVGPDEWEAIKAELRSSYDLILKLIDDTPEWSSDREIGGAIAVVAHTAYHLGEIRQALCTLQS